MGRVEGKVAFVTGAARGQGRSHAVRLAEEGADIIAVDLLSDIPRAGYRGATREDLDETVRLVEQAGGKVHAAKADVRSLPALKAAVDEGVDRFGRLDIVVANAGVLTTFAPVEELEEDDWNYLVDVNLSGVWRTAKVSIPHIKAGGRGGSIILTSSSVGLRAARRIAHYTASKAGVIGLMRTMALELAPEYIRVNTVNPTQVDTPMIQNQLMYDLFRPDLESPTRADFEEASKPLMSIPVPWVEPVDVSNAVVFLASDEARYITGVALPVDAARAIN